MKNRRMMRVSPVLTFLVAVCCAALIYGGLFLLEHEKGLVVDLTPDSLTTLSEGTRDTLGKLEEDVHIHLVFQAETASQLRQTLEILADSYARMSGRIRVDAIDPVTEPGRVRAFAESGQSIAEGSAIVTNGDESRWAVIPAREWYEYSITSAGAYAQTGFAGEQKLTAAVRSVTGEGRSRVFFLLGHGEAGMDDCTVLTQRLESDNYAVADLTLFQGESLQAGDVLLLLSPARDLTEEENAEILRFLSEGGRLLLACDASLDMSAMPHVSALAERYSLRFEPGIVIEDERMAGYWMNSPLYLMPRVHREGILAELTQEQRVILPGARAVSGPAMPLSGCSYETLLSTSERAYICPLDSATMARDDSMITGVQQLAAAVSTVDEKTGQESRVVFMGSLYTLMDNSLLNATYNMDLSCSLIAYLAAREDAAAVPVKSVTDTSMPAMTSQEIWQALALCLALPALTVLAGAIVLIRRRKK